jgi:hypothetical protein
VLVTQEYLVSNYLLVVNNEVEIMRKEALMTLFKVLCGHLPEGIEENHKRLSQDNRYCGQGSNITPLEYMS